MGILSKKALRDFVELKGQFIAILAVIIIGAMFYTGINSTFRNLSMASEKYYREYRFADLWVSLYKAPESAIGRIEALKNVDMATGRIVEDVKIDISDENSTVRLITLPETKRPVVNDILIKSGDYFSNTIENQCLVEEEFFKAHELEIGDSIFPIISGNKVKFKVTGVVKSPEYVYCLKDSTELMPDNKKFGIIYIKKSFGQAILGYPGCVNEVCVKLDEGSDIKKVKDDLEKRLKEFGIKNIVEKKDQISNRILSEEMKGLESMGSAFPVVFFIVAAVIIYIMMSRVVENQRSQIGVLKAFGYSNTKILLHYLSYSVVVGVSGIIVGCILGIFLGKFFTELENQFFHLPQAEMKIYPELAFPASILTLFFCLLAGYNSCKRVFSITPSEAMRPKSPKAGKATVLERFGFIWNKLDYSWKITVRNLFRFKKRAVLTSVGIFFSTAILVIAFGFSDSIEFMVQQQYSNIQNYDLKVNFTKFLNIEELNYIRNISYVDKIEPVIETGIEISNGWRKKNVGYTALLANSELYRVTDKSGEPVKLPSAGIVIPEKLAREMGIKKFDRVYIKPFYPRKKKKEVVIKGLVSQYIGVNAYGSMQNAQNVLKEGQIANSVVIKLVDAQFEKDVKGKLKDLITVSFIQSKSEAQKNLMKNLESMSAFVGTMIILAGILAVAVIYNITTINIFERKKELATLKVLGFSSKEIKKLVFNENFIITFMGISAGLPFGQWLGQYMVASFETDAYTFPFAVEIKTYFLSAALTVAFTLVANLILSRKLKSIDMVEVLKGNE